MTAGQLDALLAAATPAQLRAIISCAWVLDDALLARAVALAHCGGQCGCGATVDAAGVVHPAAVAHA